MTATINTGHYVAALLTYQVGEQATFNYGHATLSVFRKGANTWIVSRLDERGTVTDCVGVLAQVEFGAKPWMVANAAMVILDEASQIEAALGSALVLISA